MTGIGTIDGVRRPYTAARPRSEWHAAILNVHLAVSRPDQVPSGDAWLTPAERAALRRPMVPKRRQDWRLGRWVAKQAVAGALKQIGAGFDRTLSVLAAEDGAPELRLPGGERFPMSISISHCAGLGFAAVAAGAALGCDVERVEHRSDRFVADYLTARERAFVAAVGRGPYTRAWATTLVWSAKESALKALRQGLRADTRSVEVHAQGLDGTASGVSGSWSALEVTTRSGERLAGHWRLAAGAIWTVVASHPSRLR
jgi:4'-phosphopantetheinyl transferase